MPKRTDLRKILIIGSGPIVIGQACEFEYSGTQACKALGEEGFEVVLVNSNPATIMTDPELAQRTYVEPLTPEVVAKIIERDRPEALLPTLGGQTGLNLAVALAEDGTLERFGVELIGAKLPAIRKAEDRQLFKQAMERIGQALPRSGYARSLDEARTIVRQVGYPAIIRPSFTLGGTGGSIAYGPDELEEAVRWGLQTSPVSTVLVEESVIGWKEFELEVMRDLADNVVIICSIENVDPMGVHTGDSVTVAPAQTLTDKEYQLMRDAAIAIIREIGVETGGSNIQFAVNPEDGRLVVIEMNPRVSRSSALASKATGFPIAKIAAKLAVGYTLDEIRNDITRETPASFEPAIDYCVVKFPRWAFEKFPEADRTLTTQMKSVGEVMAIGRTFKEALQKSIRSLEQDRFSLTLGRPVDDEELRRLLRVPNPDRIFAIGEAYRAGLGTPEIHALTKIDRWFLEGIREIVAYEPEITRAGLSDPTVLRKAKQLGFADRRIAELTGTTEAAVRARRPRHVQDRGHVRRRVRRPHALPLLDLRGGGRGAADGPAQGHHPRLGAEPHRSGRRVRLLLRPRRVRAPRPRRGGHHGQLQPRDGLDRLRHLRPALLRAAHARGRAQHRREGAAARRRRPVRRPDAAQARGAPAGGGGADPRHLARRDRPRRGPRALQRAPPRARLEPSGGRHRALARRGADDRLRDRLPRARAPLVRPRRARDAARVRRPRPLPVHARGGARVARAPGAHRQVPRGD